MSDVPRTRVGLRRWRAWLNSLTAERSAFWLVVAVVATLPLEFTKEWFPVTWLEISRVLMVLAIGAGAVAAIRGREWPVMTALMLASIAFVATAAVSLLAADSMGLKELAGSLVYLVFAATVARSIRSRNDIAIVGATLVASAVLVAVVAILQQAIGFYIWRGDLLGVTDRRNSTLGDPNVAARVLTLGLLTALGLLSAPTSVQRRTVLLVVAIAATLGLGEALTQSRTLWVGTGVVLVAWVPIAIVRRRAALPMLAFVVALAGTFIVLPLVGDRASTLTPGQIVSIGLEGESPTSPNAWRTAAPPTPADPILAALPLDETRRYLIRAGVAMWLDHPWTGVGLGGYDGAIVGPYWEYVPADRRGQPTTLEHTDIVRVLAETGIIGLLGWVVFVLGYVWTSLRLLRGPTWFRPIGMTALTGFLVILGASQMAGRFTSEPYLWLLVGALIASSQLMEGERAVKEGHPSQPLIGVG